MLSYVEENLIQPTIIYGHHKEIYPLAKAGLIDMDTLIIDAKSGTSGAGRGAKVQNLYCEVNESIKAYGVASHRHTPEIEEQLGYVSSSKVLLNFTPHLIPMNRGILITAYAKLKEGVSEEEVKKAIENGFDLISLGRSRLRTETAALVACHILNLKNKKYNEKEYFLLFTAVLIYSTMPKLM